MAPIPLGLTGVLCDTRSLPLPHGTLRYTLYRPRHLSIQPPLIGVAGGPRLPSTYLGPLAHLVADRAVVLFDAVGCGRSPEAAGRRVPNSSQAVVAELVDELAALVAALDCRDYFLLGHSFGGIVVYEFLRRQAEAVAEPDPSVKKCLGAILCSTPYSIQDNQAHCHELLVGIRREIGVDPDVPDSDTDASEAARIFGERHECRIRPLPLPLQQTLQSAGATTGRAAAGLRATVADYEPTAPLEEAQRRRLPPALILRGEHDFVTQTTCAQWARLFPAAECVTLAGCAHYGLLEQEALFGGVVAPFLRRHDPPPRPLVLPRPGSK